MGPHRAPCHPLCLERSSLPQRLMGLAHKPSEGTACVTHYRVPRTQHRAGDPPQAYQEEGVHRCPLSDLHRVNVTIPALQMRKQAWT